MQQRHEKANPAVAPIEFPILNAARAFAALWVLVAHVTLIGGRPVYLLSQGYLAVECFIFISGFLMMLLLARERTLNLSSALRFYTRRFFRIAPSFYFAIALYVIFRGFYIENLARCSAAFASGPEIPGLGLEVGWRSILWNALFAHGFWPDEATKIFGPAWSLSLEMQFYLVAPIWAWFLRKRPFFAIGLYFAVNAIADVLWGVYFRQGLLANFWFPSFLPNRLFLFCWGGACCLFVIEPTRRHRHLFALASVGAAVLLPWKSLLICSILVAAILFSVFAPKNFERWGGRLAETRLVTWLAEFSYGVYLYHVFCMAITTALMLRLGILSQEQPLALPIYLTIVIAITLLVSAAIYFCVEKPARQWGKRLSGRRIDAPPMA
jgi:peptidoglycan/LPS O-acetylase OafA/YrhL